MNTLKTVEQLGRQAWLASLGAYGSGWKYAVEKLDQTYIKTNALINEFIVEGEKFELELQEKLKARELLESKIIALKNKLGLNDASEADRLQQLTLKVDDLTAAVTKLVESKLAEKAAKITAPSKNTTKKPAAKTANKS